MRIAQLITRRQLRGAEVFTGLVSERLAARGHEVTLIGLGTPLAAELRPAGVGIVDLDGVLSRLPNPALMRRVSKAVQGIGPDIVQANASHTLKYASVTKRWTAAPWSLVYWNGNMMSWFLRFPGQRLWNKWLLAPASHVVSVSERCNCDHRKTFQRASDQITTIPMATTIPLVTRNSEARRRLLECFGGTSEMPLLVHLASYVPEKNHTGLLEAFQEVLRSHPAAHLMLFGDGPLRAAVEQQIEDRRLRGSVHVMGSRTDVRDMIGGADLLLLPSHVEGLPGVILEAAAEGVPAVCTRVGGIDEAVVDGESGLLVPPGDMMQFARAVEAMLNDPVRRQRMGQAARTFVSEHYNIERVTDRFEELYEQLTCKEQE